MVVDNNLSHLINLIQFEKNFFKIKTLNGLNRKISDSLNLKFKYLRK